MIKKHIYFFICFVLIVSCSSENVDAEYEEVVPEVNFDISQVPYQTLSEYNFFDGDIKNQKPISGVVPYEPISQLFSDYALKKRFIWMPDNTTATYVNDFDVLNLPTGAVLIKSFYYNNVQPSGNTKIIETRLMIKKSTGWVFANYKWNNEQTEAHFTLEGSTVNNIEFVNNGVTRTIDYEIPSESECLTCHKKIWNSKTNRYRASKPKQKLYL